MPNPQKEARVKEIAEQLSAAQAAVLAGYRGLTVHEAAELRGALTEVDTRFSIVKNSLTRLAVKQAGLEGLDELIDGPTAIAYVQGDPVAAAKRLVEQSRKFPVLEVRGGVAEGRILTAEDFRRFAELQPRDVMLAQLAGLAKGQIARTAWIMQALQSKFLLLMQALMDKLPAEEASAAEEPAPDDSGAVDSPSVTRGVPSGEPPASDSADGSSGGTETEQAEETAEQEEGGA
ncbi:MAG: 50S ribosomal protein L10 [Actinomycetota bacterium]